MARSSITGAEPAPNRAPGRSTDLLGPSDSSDSGSDMAGIDDVFDADEPADIATAEDRARPLTTGDAIGDADSDAGGTGERAAAAGDGGREAADIAPDRIIDLSGGGDVPDDDTLEALPLEAAVDDDDDEDEEDDEEEDGEDKA